MISLKDILLEGMSVDVANTIFQKFGIVRASTLDKSKLKDYYIALVKKHHPDAGGNNDEMRMINAAYDILKKTPTQSYKSSWPYDSSDKSWPHEPEEDDDKYSYNHANKRWERQKTSGYAAWAQAGHSGGRPNSDQISNENFSDINYCKKMAWEISGKPPCNQSHDYTIWNWDGEFFRGVFSVYAIPEKMFQISKMMMVWDNSFRSVAVFYFHRSEPKKLYLVNKKGIAVNPPQVFEHHSFNMNPGNDKDFVEFLRTNL